MKQLILKIFQEKLRNKENIENTCLKDIIKQVNTELAGAEKIVTEFKDGWSCKKCTLPFEYCWCNRHDN